MSINRKPLIHPLRWLDFANSAGRWLGTAGLVILVLLICQEVFRRYFLNSPTAFSVEYSSVLSIMVGYLGFMYATRICAHINVNIVLNRLSKKTRGSLNIFSAIISFLFSGVLAWQMWNFVIFTHKVGLKTVDTHISIYIVAAVPAICLSLMTFEFILKTYEYIQVVTGKLGEEDVCGTPRD